MRMQAVEGGLLSLRIPAPVSTCAGTGDVTLDCEMGSAANSRVKTLNACATNFRPYGIPGCKAKASETTLPRTPHGPCVQPPAS